MRKRYIFISLAVLFIIGGCSKNKAETSQQDSDNKKNESVSQDNSDSKENKEETTETSQESEYSAEKADSVLEGLGIKSYDIWSYLRPETGEETESFFNMEYEKYLTDLAENNVGQENAQEKEKYIEVKRNAIHGRYKIEQEEPLIIKVNCKNETGSAYLSETKWQEQAYAYLSENGYLFKDNNRWYEIQGYNDYKELNWVLSPIWWYSGDGKNGECYTMRITLYGYDKRDEGLYNEESIKEKYCPEAHIPEGIEQEYKEGDYTYSCEELIVHVHYRIDYNISEEENNSFVEIFFYTMLDEYKAVTCRFSTWDRTGYYNNITEEMLREIFTIREYK